MLLAVVFAAVCCSAVISYEIPQLQEKVIFDVEDAPNLFEQYLNDHGKTYKRHEYWPRLQIFKENLKEINELNANFPDTVFGLTRFTDMLKEERQQYLGFLPSNSTVTFKPKLSSGGDVPDSFDWRDKNVVTHVKDQGGCGSCYIFSAIGNIEGQYAIKNKQCVALSEQQVLDCLKDQTCNGGFPHTVMELLAKDPAGSMSEEDYPYQEKEQTCKESASKRVATVKGGGKIDISDEEALKKTLVDTGPLSIALEAIKLFHYNGGVFPGANCESDLDHALVLVGYGEEKGKKYWLIKNSWGEKWGEKGYLRLERGVKACGFGTYGATAQVA